MRKLPINIYITLGLDPWLFGGARLREAVRNKEEGVVDIDYKWRAPYLRSLLSRRMEAHFNNMTEEEERLSELINSLVYIVSHTLFHWTARRSNTADSPYSLYIQIMVGLSGNMKPKRTGWIKIEHMVKQDKIQLYSTQN